MREFLYYEEVTYKSKIFALQARAKSLCRLIHRKQIELRPVVESEFNFADAFVLDIFAVTLNFKLGISFFIWSHSVCCFIHSTFKIKILFAEKSNLEYLCRSEEIRFKCNLRRSSSCDCKIWLKTFYSGFISNKARKIFNCWVATLK